MITTNSLVVLEQDYQELNTDGQEILQGLSQTPKTLPCRFFYDDHGSELFNQICQLPEYYPTRTETEILRESASAIAQMTGPCTLVELGSGNATKTRLLLDAYQQGDYLPIDISAGILRQSVDQLQREYPSFTVQGLVGTYEQALVHLQTCNLGPQMIFFLGSSLGNFNVEQCDRFFSQIAQTLKPGDYFLLGVDLEKSPETLELAYNDSQGVTAAFNLNILNQVNRCFGGNFNPQLFRHKAIYNPVAGQIEMYLYSQTDQRITLNTLELEINLAAGEGILTEISRKFNLASLQAQLASHGLHPVRVWTDPQQWFGLVLCQAHQ